MPSICSSGLRMAEVIEVAGDKDELNRITTKLVSEGPAQGITLDRAPVLTDCAGSGYGNVSLPKKGDFVIVAFLDNDMQRPIILGSIPTPKTKPPKRNNNNIRLHKTADGTEITIDEDKDNPKVSIKTKSGHQVILSDSGLAEVKSEDGKTSLTMDLKKRTVEVKARAIHFKGENEVSIKSGDSSITVSNSSGVNIKSPEGKITLNSGSQEFKSTSTMKLQSTATLSLKSNAVTEVVGTSVKIG